jgi:GR25 family glycosyltransferase involved in LPS biosynthesis
MHYKDTTYMYDSRIRSNKTKMKRGEFGCAWSHLNLLKQLVDESENVNYYLILEDDVELVKPIDELNKLLQNIPEDTDMCHLAKSDWFPFMKTKAVNDYFTECVKAYFNRTTAYIISKTGAKKVLNYINNHIDIPIDDLYNIMYRENQDFRFYVPVASYFFQEQSDAVSTIHKINDN